MAIIQCPECGGQASDSAAACPNCGFGIAEFVHRQRAQRQAQEAARLTRERKAMKMKFWGLIAGLMVVIFGPCCIWSQCEISRRAEEAAVAEQARVEQERAQQQIVLEQTRKNRPQILKQADEAIEKGDVPIAARLITNLQQAFPQDPEVLAAAKRLEDKRAELAAATAKSNAEEALTKAEKLRKNNPVAADNLLVQHIKSVTTHREHIDGADDVLKRLETMKKRNQKAANKVREKKAKELKAAEEEKRRCPDGNCIEVSATDLCRQYQANEVRADNDFRNRTLLVKGKITEISKGPLDGLYVHMGTGNSCFLSVAAHVPKSQADFLAKMNKGNTVEVRCKGSGMTLGSPTLSDCRALEFWGR